MSMGRGSDTRIYAPRSESTNLLSSSNEDETKYNPTSPEDNDKRAEEKKLKDEHEKQKGDDIKHIKIKPSQGLGEGPKLPTEPGLDDGNKRDDEREIGLQGGPAGSRGHLLDMATGAKSGTGSSMNTGVPIAMGEPMDGAWSELLKEEPTVHPGENQYKHQYKMPNHDDVHPDWVKWIDEVENNPAEYEGVGDDWTQDDMNHLAGSQSREEFFKRMQELSDYQRDDAPPIDHVNNFRDVPFNEETDFTMSEPMDGAWSTLLKRDTPGLMEGRRRREKRQEFRPSTGQFKRPPGGQTPAGATMRRFRAHMRGIKGGKKTGLMKPHLSVEMSHRGIATKQPMSKDPQRYGQYMGQQEARKILGNVRTTYSPHARHSARSFTAGPTGGGRLTGLLPGQSGQMAQPALRPMRRPRMPRMRQPRMPGLTPPPQMGQPMSSVPNMPSMAPPPPPQMMMSDERTASDLLKSNRHANRTEMLALMRMLIQAQRAKNSMKKAKANFYDGAVPAHPSPVHQHEDEDEKNDGPTQNLETNSSRLGLDPAGYLSSKTGHMG